MVRSPNSSRSTTGPLPAAAAGRVAQGVAGAGVIAAGLGLVGGMPPAHKARATALWSGALGAGIAVGVLGGLAVLVLALRVPSDVPAPVGAGRPARRLDLPAAVAVTIATATLVAGITVARTGAAGLALALVGVSVVAVVVFVRHERRTAAPMVELALLRLRGFRAVNVGAVVTGLSTIAVMSYAPGLLVRATTLSPWGAGLVVAVWSVTSAVVAALAHRLPAGWDARRRLQLGLSAAGLGCAALALAGPVTGWPMLLPGLLVAGVGSGLGNAALARLAIESVPAADAAMGSGASNTSRYLGSAVGIALVVALAAPATTAPGELVGALWAGWDRAALFAAAMCALGVLGTLGRRDSRVSTG